MHNASLNSALLLMTATTGLGAQATPRLAWHTPAMDSVRVERGGIGLIAAYADAGQRERAFAEVANLPTMWNKAEILKNNPKLAAYRNDAEFIERMR